MLEGSEGHTWNTRAQGVRRYVQRAPATQAAPPTLTGVAPAAPTLPDLEPRASPAAAEPRSRPAERQTAQDGRTGARVRTQLPCRPALAKHQHLEIQPFQPSPTNDQPQPDGAPAQPAGGRSNNSPVNGAGRTLSASPRHWQPTQKMQRLQAEEQQMTAVLRAIGTSDAGPSRKRTASGDGLGATAKNRRLATPRQLRTHRRAYMTARQPAASVWRRLEHVARTSVMARDPIKVPIENPAAPK